MYRDSKHGRRRECQCEDERGGTSVGIRASVGAVGSSGGGGGGKNVRNENGWMWEKKTKSTRDVPEQGQLQEAGADRERTNHEIWRVDT